MTRLAIVESDAASAVDLVTDGRRWGVQLSGVDLRWHASKIEASKEYLKHVAADRGLDAPPERKPSAGWVELAGNYYLAASEVFARSHPTGWWWVYRGRWTPAEWQRTSHHAVREGRTAPGPDTAKLAAEDSLLAIAAGIVGAVGR